jgi:tetratricopeptide repeat protein 21B
LLANALIAVESGDIKKAMSILKGVKSESPYFVESRKMLAEIHLNNLKNRKGYAKCYYEIIEAVPTFENFKIYGDGLIKINEPEEAAIAYEKAYQERNDHEGIIRDLGRAYALAHDYEKATKFYEDNIEKLNRPDLILDLAKLCIQLRRYDRAEQLLTSEVFAEENGPTDRLKQNVEANLQLYKLYIKKQGPYDLSMNEKARKYIKTAAQLQKIVIEKIRSEGGAAEEERMA